MQLTDVFPEKPEFFLSSTKKMHRLRLVNLEDRAWLRNHLGTDEQINKIFSNADEMDWEKIMKFAYRLLEDKSDFLAQELTEINDEGVEVTKLVTGPELFMRAVAGLEEAVHVMGACTRAITLANPLINKVVDDQLKKNNMQNRIGAKSSTRSRANTAGRQSK